MGRNPGIRAAAATLMGAGLLLAAPAFATNTTGPIVVNGVVIAGITPCQCMFVSP